jgi:hypothetical protein
MEASTSGSGPAAGAAAVTTLAIALALIHVPAATSIMPPIVRGRPDPGPVASLTRMLSTTVLPP